MKEGKEGKELFEIILLLILQLVSTMGLGPTTSAKRPRPTKDHRMTAQSAGPIVLIYKASPYIHH